MPAPLVSVVVPARNEEEDLPSVVSSICSQRHRNLELIIVDDGSKDGTLALAKAAAAKDRRVKVLHFPGGHSAAFARNRGAEKARGKYVLFVDADCVSTRDFVGSVVDAFGKGRVGGVATRTLNQEPTTFLARCIAAQRKLGFDVASKTPRRVDASTPILISNYRLSAFRKLGGFDESLFYFEDRDLTARFHKAGFKAVYSPSSVQYHADPRTLGESLRQARWFGKGIAFNFLRFGDFRPFLVPAAFSGLLLVALASVPVPSLRLLFLAGLLPLFGYWLRLSIASRDPLASAGMVGLLWLRNLVKLAYSSYYLVAGRPGK